MAKSINAALLHKYIFAGGTPSAKFPSLEQYFKLPQLEQYQLLKREVDIIDANFLDDSFTNVKSNFIRGVMEYFDRQNELRMLNSLLYLLIEFLSNDSKIPHNLTDLMIQMYHNNYRDIANKVAREFYSKTRKCLSQPFPTVIPTYCNDINCILTVDAHLTEALSVFAHSLRYTDENKIYPILDYKKFCLGCNTFKTDKLLRCGKCKRARYCSVECQEKNWNSHKDLCKRYNNSESTREVFTMNEFSNIGLEKPFEYTIAYNVLRENVVSQATIALAGLVANLPVFESASRSSYFIESDISADGKSILNEESVSFNTVVLTNTIKPDGSNGKLKLSVTAMYRMGVLANKGLLHFIQKVVDFDNNVIGAFRVELMVKYDPTKKKEYREIIRALVPSEEVYNALLLTRTSIIVRLP